MSLLLGTVVACNCPRIDSHSYARGIRWKGAETRIFYLGPGVVGAWKLSHPLDPSITLKSGITSSIRPQPTADDDTRARWNCFYQLLNRLSSRKTFQGRIGLKVNSSKTEPEFRRINPNLVG